MILSARKVLRKDLEQQTGNKYSGRRLLLQCRARIARIRVGLAVMADEQQKSKSSTSPAAVPRALARAEALRANLKRRKAQERSRAPAAEPKDAPRRGGA